MKKILLVILLFAIIFLVPFLHPVGSFSEVKCESYGEHYLLESKSSIFPDEVYPGIELRISFDGMRIGKGLFCSALRDSDVNTILFARDGGVVEVITSEKEKVYIGEFSRKCASDIDKFLKRNHYRYGLTVR